jgi:hypothetical protein
MPNQPRSGPESMKCRMTPRQGLSVAVVGLLTAVHSVGALALADASGQPKPSVERTLLALGAGFGLIVMVVGLIVHGHFASRLFGILVGAFVAFWVGAAFGFLITTGSEGAPAAFGFFAAIGWLILAGTLWGNIRKVRSNETR